MSVNPLPYPNALQCRQTTAAHRAVAAAAVRAYRDTLSQQNDLVHEDDDLFSEEEAERLRHRAADQAAANATAAQFRKRAGDVVATVRGDVSAGGDGLDIFHAACDGDVGALEACVQGGVDVNGVGQPDPARYGSGVQFQQRWLFCAPPLVFAAAFGREDAVRCLLEYGADPRVPSSTGLRAQDYAARRGYGVIVELLARQSA